MRRLLVDMSSVLWQNLLAGKDTENGRELPHPDPEKAGKLVHVNSAEFGFENFVNNFVSILTKLEAVPRDVVMVFDGKGAKLLRQSIDAGYKAGRDHHPASYEEFEKLRDKARETLLSLGAIAVWQDGMEADDVLCYLSKNLKSHSVIVSNDGDMTVLQREGVDFYNTYSGEMNVNKYGPFPSRFVTLYKALVGDSSDKIKGAFKFGPKAFIDLYVAFGGDSGLEAMEELIANRELDRLAEDVPQLKSLQRIIDSKDAVYASWDLARMYPDKVNTMRKPLQVQAGMVRQWHSDVHDERLRPWYGTMQIVHAGNINNATAWTLGQLLESPDVAFDIEGSTPAESDDWMEAKKRAAGLEDSAKGGVDALGSKLAGYSMTFGANGQHSIYVPVDHVETPTVRNVAMAAARHIVELIPDSKPIVVQNASFELAVLFKHWGEAWKNNGWQGFLPNVYDTMVMKSYVDENSSRALKKMSAEILGYEQTTYDQVTQGGTLKMNQLTAEQVVAYGCDDSICTSALFNYFRFVMELEDSMRIMEMVGRKPLYLNALRFVQGTPISMERMLKLERDDEKSYDEAWALVRDFLISQGWSGSVCPQFTDQASFTPAAIKEAFLIITEEELDTRVRTPEKMFKLVGEKDQLLGDLLEDAYVSGSVGSLNTHLQNLFKGEPEFNTDSPKHMQALLYTTLKLPVRLRNKATDAMRAKGIKQGNPRADDFALEFALKYDAPEREPEVTAVLKALQTMRVMATRSKLYYVPYRHMRHWTDNLVHSQVNQFSTVTRRDSDSDPNKQQLGKNVKHGHKPHIREVFVAHHKDAVVVSLDFTGQELRGVAEFSQDGNMLACFSPPPGEKKKDMHAMTAEQILRKKPITELCRIIGVDDAQAWDGLAGATARWKGCTYDDFIVALNDPAHEDSKLYGELRQIGKKVNFVTEYGAQALKVSETLIIMPEEAQQLIDAKEATFPRAAEWKKEVIAETYKLGYSTTMLGARRHLREALLSTNRYDSSKAERQSVNFKIQGSAAEQTKLAEARMWDRGIYFKYDARYIGPVHDELVSSVAVKDLVPFLIEQHAAMTENYGGMRVPIVASISFGHNYGEQIEVGETVDEERINEALRSLGFVNYDVGISSSPAGADTLAA